MKNNKRKGFTLVELLVVIAILAILATVTMVGYTAFLKKANQSNAVTELTQIRDVVNAVILDGEEEIATTTTGVTDVATVVPKKDGDNIVVTAKKADGDPVTLTEDNVKACFIAVISLLTERTDLDINNIVVTLTTGKVTSIQYLYETNASATWILGRDVEVD